MTCMSSKVNNVMDVAGNKMKVIRNPEKEAANLNIYAVVLKSRRSGFLPQLNQIITLRHMMERDITWIISS